MHIGKKNEYIHQTYKVLVEIRGQMKPLFVQAIKQLQKRPPPVYKE